VTKENREFKANKVFKDYRGCKAYQVQQFLKAIREM
jgi:hypothetical protein